MAVVGQLTGGRLYDRIHYHLYLNNTHSGGVSLQQTKERKYIISNNRIILNSEPTDTLNVLHP